MALESTKENRPVVRSAVSIEIVPISVRTDEYRVQIDPSSGQRPSTAIVEAIAALTDIDPLELEPLGDQIDPEHLDELFISPSNSDRQHISVSFFYAGYHIDVSETKHITNMPRTVVNETDQIDRQYNSSPNSS